jgi:hypothetical protein
MALARAAADLFAGEYDMSRGFVVPMFCCAFLAL